MRKAGIQPDAYCLATAVRHRKRIFWVWILESHVDSSSGPGPRGHRGRAGRRSRKPCSRLSDVLVSCAGGGHRGRATALLWLAWETSSFLSKTVLPDTPVNMIPTSAKSNGARRAGLAAADVAERKAARWLQRAAGGAAGCFGVTGGHRGHASERPLLPEVFAGCSGIAGGHRGHASERPSLPEVLLLARNLLAPLPGRKPGRTPESNS
jgi:hypothetical protein